MMERETPFVAPPWRKRIVRTMAAGAIGATLGGSIAMANTSVETEIFPHNVTVELTVGSVIDVDLGLLGIVSIFPENPALGGLIGANVEVNGIPNPEDLSINDIQSLDDLRQYATLYANIEPSIEHAVRDVERELTTNALLGGASGALLLVFLYKRYGDKDWRTILDINNRTALMASLLAVSVLNAPVALETSQTKPGQSVNIPHFGTIAGNDLVTDLAVGLAKQALDIQQSGDEFLETASASLDQALSIRNPADFAQFNNFDQIVVVSDVHCNIYTATIAAQLADRVDAKFLIDLGDSTNFGSSAEAFCFDPYRYSDAIKLWVRGNHDSSTTDRLAREAGFTVIDGGLVTIDSYGFYGAADPARTEVGDVVDYASRTEAINLTGSDVADDIATQSQKVDYLLTHDPRVGAAAIETGLVDAQLSGHMHHTASAIDVLANNTVLLDASSLSGALPVNEREGFMSSFAIQPPQTDVEFPTLLARPGEKPSYFYITTVHGDNSVTISNLVRIS